MVALLVVLIRSYRWWPLPDLSHLLLAIFLVRPIIGNHYTYEKESGRGVVKHALTRRSPSPRPVFFRLLPHLRSGVGKSSTARPMPGPRNFVLLPSCASPSG